MKRILAILSILASLPTIAQVSLTIPGPGKNIFIPGSSWDVIYNDTEGEHSLFDGIGRYSPLPNPTTEIVDGTFFDKYLACNKINGKVTTEENSSSASITCTNFVADSARFSSHTSFKSQQTHMELEVTCTNRKPKITKAHKYTETLTIDRYGQAPITITPTGEDNEVHHFQFTNDPAVDVTITFNEVIEVKSGNKIDIQKNAINIRTNDLNHIAGHARIQAECK